MIVVCVTVIDVAEAATPLSADERAVVHFAFGTQLGSGIYVISGRTVQIYRLPFGYALRQGDDDSIGIRLTLPVTIGFIGFKVRDVIDTGLPQNLDTLSFVPGLEFDVPVTDRWRLRPFGEVGVARDRTSDFDQRVYAVGLRSDFALGESATEWSLFNELVYVGVELKQIDDPDDFTRFRTGLTASQPLGRSVRRRQPDILLYGLNEWYIDPPNGPVNGDDGRGGRFQWEIGATFGATEQLYVWRIPIPRIGIGYRFGNDLSVFRLVFGSPF